MGYAAARPGVTDPGETAATALPACMSPARPGGSRVPYEGQTGSKAAPGGSPGNTRAWRWRRPAPKLIRAGALPQGAARTSRACLRTRIGHGTSCPESSAPAAHPVCLAGRRALRGAWRWKSRRAAA